MTRANWFRNGSLFAGLLSGFDIKNYFNVLVIKMMFYMRDVSTFVSFFHVHTWDSSELAYWY